MPKVNLKECTEFEPLEELLIAFNQYEEQKVVILYFSAVNYLS